MLERTALTRRAATRLLVGSVVAGTAVALGAIATLPRGLQGDELTLLLGSVALAMTAVFFLQARPLTLPWNGERLAILPDEAVLVVMLYHAPPGAAVAVVAAGTLMSQLFLQKPPVKAAFNVAVLTIAAGAAAALHYAALVVGLTPAAAVAFAPFVYTMASQTLVALLLTRMRGASPRTVLRPELAKSIMVAGGAGLILGGVTVALLEVHWAALAGAIVFALVLHRALSAEYRHESELAARRALTTAMHRLTGRVDEEDIVEAVHEACCEAFSLRRFDVTLQHPDRPPRSWSFVSGMASSEPVASVRAPLVTATGARIGELVLTVGARSRRRLQEDEELAGVFAGYLATAAGQAEALRLLDESRQRLREAFDAAPDPILVVERDGRVAFANRSALTAFGDAPPAEALLAARDPPTLGAGTVQATTQAGVEYECVVASLTLEGGEPGGILIARDVSERRRVEELARRNERLTALGTLVSGIAHEINNPLTYMGGQLEMAIDDLAAVEPREDASLDVEGMQAALRSVLRGTKRIEFISRGLAIVGRSAPARHDAVPVNIVVQDALSRLALPEGVHLTLDLDAREPTVEGDAAEVRQVVVQLAKNAVDAVTERGGRVLVQTLLREGVLEVTVADDGPGMDADARSRLFTPFYTTKIDGVGLGLPIVHSLVRAHGGDVVVESAPGRGSRFRARFGKARATR